MVYMHLSDWSQSGASVTAADAGWNGQVAADESREVFGFIASGPAATPEVGCEPA
ncbi:cellulose binding domain-containing protein [Glycomyces salinus]|uniref:cellulose binding domain-containing protein n=1 Tax=Glycomyces salinus TaxID=980294 RepID=UPI0018EBB9E9|nr:cellulose binding domain-containing protein [Glycomyces salinus]